MGTINGPVKMLHTQKYKNNNCEVNRDDNE